MCKPLFFFVQQLSAALDCHWPKVMVNKIIYASPMTAKLHTSQITDHNAIHEMKKKTSTKKYGETNNNVHCGYKHICIRFHACNTTYWITWAIITSNRKQQLQCTPKHTLNQLHARNILFLLIHEKLHGENNQFCIENLHWHLLPQSDVSKAYKIMSCVL